MVDVVAVATLVRCWTVEEVRDGIGDLERACGGWSDGRFAWELADVQAIDPVPCLGSLGIFELPLLPAAHVIRRIDDLRRAKA